MNMKRSLVAAAWLAFAAGPALAQTEPGAAGSNQVIPEKESPASPPANTDPGMKTGRSLSQKLNESDGVIKPPAGVDPDISKKPPVSEPNSMPVIKPPAGGEAK